MQKTLRQFFAPPIFPEDEDKTRSASIINVIGWSGLVVVVALLVLRTIQGQDVNLIQANVAMILLILAIALVLYLTRQGFVKAASMILVSTTWLGLSYLTWIADGIRDAAYLAYSIPILMAGLLLGWQGASIFTIFSILSGWSLAYGEANGFFAPTLDTSLHFARDTTGIFVLEAVLIYLMISSLQNALRKSRAITKELSDSNLELDGLRVELEHRVEERTSELEKRASQMEAVSSVARTITSVQDIDRLLPAIAKLISQKFGFYHVGIFLLDPQGKQANLHAANSEGGLRLIEQEYGLLLDHKSLVGDSIASGEPRIAKDTDLHSFYISSPVLPATRTEIAIPLQLAGTVIGALDIQSTQANGFSPEDIRVLMTLGDQVAIAIENARLFSEANRALGESRSLLDKYTQQEWRNFAQQTKPRGFVFDGKQITPLYTKTKYESIKAIAQTGSLSLDKASATISIPIKLRGQTIGVLDVRSKKGARDWNQDEINLLEAAAERAALALENARLIETAQRRAARERAIGDISSKIGAVSNLESILQTAVEELGRKIGGAMEVTLEFSNDDGQDQNGLVLNR